MFRRVSAFPPLASPAVISLFSPDTMPDVTVGSPPLPSALPIAITVSLTATRDESPSVTVLRFDTFLILMTAMSLVAS